MPANYIRNIAKQMNATRTQNLTFAVYRGIKSCFMKDQRRSQHAQALRTLYSLVSPQKVQDSLYIPDCIEKPQYVMSELLEPKGPDVEIKTKQQITGMREVCRIARRILNAVSEELKIGMSTDEIDVRVHEMCVAHNAYPSPLKYMGFPKSVCTSVNNVACHGIPDSRQLEDGDVINVDVTVFYDGFHGDLSETYLVGNVDESGKKLVNVARDCRDIGVNVCGPGARFCDIGNAISTHAERNGFSVIPMFCGHGIGTYFHGPPDIFHVAYEDDAVMEEGMTFTIEPIISEGSPEIRILEDGWTVVSLDDSRSAQFEHTVLITSSGVEILTL